MTKADLIETLAKASAYSKKDAADLVEEVFFAQGEVVPIFETGV